MQWKDGEVFEISYGKTRKITNKQAYRWIMLKKKIPLPYARLTQQFLLEVAHGKVNSSHEAQRRYTYAQLMLDLFGYELDLFCGPADEFRSKVYTPVLQRQLKGVHDAYAPSIKRAIAQSDEDPTIAQVTRFYLGNDPLDPRCIPCYRRNIIYTREVFWHLAMVTGKMTYDSAKDFESSLFYHDLILKDLQKRPKPSGRGIPVFSQIEAASIIALELEGYFAVELTRTVCVDSTATSRCANCALFKPWYLEEGLALREQATDEEDTSPNHGGACNHPVPVPKSKGTGDDNQLEDEEDEEDEEIQQEDDAGGSGAIAAE